MPIPLYRAIVIVDADAAICTLLARAMQHYFPDHPVYTCPTPADALTSLADTPAACVLMDAVSEAADAAFVQAIRAHWPDLPIVLMTGLEPWMPLARTQDTAPYAAVLIKPMSLHLICDTIRPFVSDETQFLERTVGA